MLVRRGQCCLNSSVYLILNLVFNCPAAHLVARILLFALKLIVNLKIKAKRAAQKQKQAFHLKLFKNKKNRPISPNIAQKQAENAQKRPFFTVFGLFLAVFS